MFFLYFLGDRSHNHFWNFLLWRLNLFFSFTLSHMGFYSLFSNFFGIINFLFMFVCWLRLLLLFLYRLRCLFNRFLFMSRLWLSYWLFDMLRNFFNWRSLFLYCRFFLFFSWRIFFLFGRFFFNSFLFLGFFLLYRLCLFLGLFMMLFRLLMVLLRLFMELLRLFLVLLRLFMMLLRFFFMIFSLNCYLNEFFMNILNLLSRG